MAPASYATWMLEQEARALLTRLKRIKPFALHETMLPAASLLPAAQIGIERYLMGGRRLRFNAVLTQFDLFNDALTQRSESEVGVWLSGLEVVSADALTIPGHYYEVPPVIC